jgi:MYXO-CTERM domain-containing protein
MRRLLLAAAVSVPIAVVAAISTAPRGKVVDLDNYNTRDATSYINAAQCSGDAPLNLEWSTNVTAGGGDSYQLYASSAPPDASGLCETEDIPGTGGAATVNAGPIDGGGAWTSNIQRGEASGAQAIAAANRTCTENQVLYICAHLLDGGDTTNPVGSASGKFIVQIAAPSAPTLHTVGPASETSLVARWTEPTGLSVDHYVVVATAGTEEHRTGTIFAPATSATISGLSLGTTYSVVVFAFSLGGNPSPASNAMDGTPSPVDDFWETYLNSGGRDDGGCATGSAGPLALLGVAALLRLRRRK